VRDTLLPSRCVCTPPQSFPFPSPRRLTSSSLHGLCARCDTFFCAIVYQNVEEYTNKIAIYIYAMRARHSSR
jgi:hypothetical protein